MKVKAIPAAMTSMRLAEPSDIPRISEFYRRAASPNVHPRDASYIAATMATRDGRGFFVVQEDPSTGEVVACREGRVAIGRRDVGLLLEGVIDGTMRGRGGGGLPYSYREGDVLVYHAGVLRCPQSRGIAGDFLGRSSRLIATRVLPPWVMERREAWSRLGPNDRAGPGDPVRPPRIVHCYGAKSAPEETLQFFVRNFEESFLPGEPTSYLGSCENPVPGDDGGAHGLVHFHVHDPPLTSHQAERTGRNRYLITEAEQRKLLSARVGFVGLSTGSVALEALLREGVGGTVRVADADRYEASNSNRMLFGVADVGSSKVDLCEGQVRAVDPHVVVERFPDGIHERNVDALVSGCDLVVEECDDFRAKILVRMAARRMRVPVLMGTSQKGMIDVERYDVDPGARPFHLDDPSVLEHVLTVSSNGGLSAAEKNDLLPLIFDLPGSVSTRFLESAKEIGKSISSWPQLAEEVFLNAATIAHASRRILLGDDGSGVASGRYAIDMSEMFRPCDCIKTYSQGRSEATAEQSDDTTVNESPDGNGLWEPYFLDTGKLGKLKELMFVSHWASAVPRGCQRLPWLIRLIVESTEDAAPKLNAYLNSDVDTEQRCWVDTTLGVTMFNAEVAAAHLGKVVVCQEENAAPDKVAFTLAAPRNESEREKVVEYNRIFTSLKHRAGSRPKRHPGGATYVSQALREKLVGLNVLVAEESNSSPSIIDVRKSAKMDTEAERLQSAMYGIVSTASDNGKSSIKDASSNQPVATIEALRQSLGEERITNESNVKEKDSWTEMFLVLCDSGADMVAKGSLLARVWLEATWHGYTFGPLALSTEHLKGLHPSALVALHLIKPSSSRL